MCMMQVFEKMTQYKLE